MDIKSIIKEQRQELERIERDEKIISREKTEDLDKILQAFYELYGDIEYIILDELQNVPKLELFATRLRVRK